MEFQLPAGAMAPSLARATLAAVAHPSREVADDVMLLTSEVVTNAIRHSGSAPHDVIVRVETGEDAIHVEVLNAGASFDPEVPADPSPSGTGLGLFLVDRLASRWGVEREGGRTKVWFDVPASGRAAAARS